MTVLSETQQRDFVIGSLDGARWLLFMASTPIEMDEVSCRLVLDNVFDPDFQTGTTDRIVSCGVTGMTDNGDECLATQALREGLRRGAGRILPVQKN